MSKYKIIDAHAHIFPSKIAQKAVKSIGGFYDIPMDAEGTSERLIESGKEINVEKYVVCSTATKPEQVRPINEFIQEECNQHSEFIGYATLHPYMDNIEEEVEYILSNKIYKGVKLHPDFQEFNIDDEKALKMYKLLEGKLAILFHTGDKRYNYSNPHLLQRVAEMFPDLKCIAAHFGGYSEWDEAFNIYKAHNIYMDTSSSLFELDKDYALRFFDKFGIEKFFFGTDFPMWTHKEELNRFFELGLAEELNKKVLYDNYVNAILR